MYVSVLFIFTSQTRFALYGQRFFNPTALLFLPIWYFIFTTNHHFYKWPSQSIINFASSSPPCSQGVTAKDPLSCLIVPDLSASLCFPQKAAGWCFRKQVKPCNSQGILWHRNSLVSIICLCFRSWRSPTVLSSSQYCCWAAQQTHYSKASLFSRDISIKKNKL